MYCKYTEDYICSFVCSCCYGEREDDSIHGEEERIRQTRIGQMLYAVPSPRSGANWPCAATHANP